MKTEWYEIEPGLRVHQPNYSSRRERQHVKEQVRRIADEAWKRWFKEKRMFEHKGVKIQLDEATGFVAPGSFTVSNKNGMVYRAASVYGESYANNPQDALAGAKKQINDNVR